MAARGLRKTDTGDLLPWRCPRALPSYDADFHLGLGSRFAKGADRLWNPRSGRTCSPQNAPERRYALGVVKRRLHQIAFREAVISAYNGRCAVSRLPEQRLLDAAHIVSDKDERLGQPVVQNGLPLSKSITRHLMRT